MLEFLSARSRSSSTSANDACGYPATLDKLDVSLGGICRALSCSLVINMRDGKHRIDWRLASEVFHRDLRPDTLLYKTEGYKCTYFTQDLIQNQNLFARIEGSALTPSQENELAAKLGGDKEACDLMIRQSATGR